MKTTYERSRRRFIKLGLLGLGSMPLIPLMGRNAVAADGELVDENSAAAQAIGYVHDATTVDSSQWPKRAGEDGGQQFCYNCNLYQGSGQEGVGGCAIFPGKKVKAQGWCNAWVGKSGG